MGFNIPTINIQLILSSMIIVSLQHIRTYPLNDGQFNTVNNPLRYSGTPFRLPSFNGKNNSISIRDLSWSIAIILLPCIAD
jgi:hypothetical protein